MVTRSRRARVALVVLALGLLPAQAGAQSSEFPYSEDFEGAVGGEWTPANVATSPSGQRFLGRFGDQTARLSLTDLPQHAGLRVALDLHIIGTMDGSSTEEEEEDGITFAHGPDLFSVTVDGTTPLAPTTFSNVKTHVDYMQAYPGSHPAASNPGGTGAFATDSLGYPPDDGSGDRFFGDSTYRLEFTVPHSASAATVSIVTAGLVDPNSTIEDDESWGIDNVSVDTCDVDVKVGLATARGCFVERGSSGVFETDQEAWVGGFHFRPGPDGKLVVQDRPESPLAAEGPVDLVLGPVSIPAPLAELHPFVPDFAMGFNTAGSIERFAALPLLQGASSELKVTWDPGGRGAKIAAAVSMQKLTESLGTPLAGQLGLGGTSIGTLAGKLDLALANGKPATVEAGELEIPEYAIELAGTNPKIKEGFGGGKLTAKRVGDTVEWSGEVKLLFPWQGESGANQGEIAGRIYYRGALLAGLGLSASGFERQIGKTGFDLVGIEGDVIYQPAFAFNVGITAQHHSSFGGVPLLKLTGNLKGLQLASECANGSNPYAFVGAFNSPTLEEQDLGELKGQVVMCAYLAGARDFAFEAGVNAKLTVDVGPFSQLFAASGAARGWFHGIDFNLDGSYDLQLPVIGAIGAIGVISSEGYAVCGRYGFISMGIATNNWLESPTEMQACDFTPFRVATPGGASAAASRTKRVRVKRGSSAAGFAVRGSDGAPRVRVLGPRGERFVSPSGDKPLKTRRAIVFSVDELETTYVYLRRPRRGRWGIAPLGGESSIKRVDQARRLPAPRIRVRVRRKGAAVVLRWKTRRAPGRRIALVDRGLGVATVVQSPTAKRKGRVRFTPLSPNVRERRIEALIVQNGAPRPSRTVAKYTLAAQ